MREYHYTVDREGRVFHERSEIIDPQVLRFFLAAMKRTPAGDWLVVCQGERNWFAVDGTPFVVRRVVPVQADGTAAALDLVFAGDYRERLDPGTLGVVDGELACRVRRGAFAARFGRVALQQIAPFLVDDADRPALVLGPTRHPIADAAAARA